MADQIEYLKVMLAFICTPIQLSYFDLEKFEDTMTASRQKVKDLLRSILDDADNNIGCKYNNMNHLLWDAAIQAFKTTLKSSSYLPRFEPWNNSDRPNHAPQ